MTDTPTTGSPPPDEENEEIEDNPEFENPYELFRDPDTYEVRVESDLEIEDYEKSTPPEDWAMILSWAKQLAETDASVVFINPTMEGGGVAMMRPPLIHLMTLLGIEAHWYVMEIEDGLPDDKNPAVITKKIHNKLHGSSNEPLTPDDKERHIQWADGENGPILEKQEAIRNATYLVIDDPQPTPLIDRLKMANPDAKLIWRYHIHTDGKAMADPNTTQGEVGTYLLDELGVDRVDAVMTHPVEDFVNPRLDKITTFGPATIELNDAFNRKLSEQEVSSGIDFINSDIDKNNQLLIEAGRENEVQATLSKEPRRKRITLIARFDPQKGMDLGIKMGVQTRQKMRDAGVPEDELPEIVIVGNGSIDDPDGPTILEKLLAERMQLPEQDRNSVIIARLPHNPNAINALMENSDFIMQPSTAEGFETRVTDAIIHGIPVVVSSRGGIKTQVIEGMSGLVLDFHKPDYDLPKGAEFLSYHLMNRVAYEELVRTTKQAAEEFNKREFVTAANAARWMRLFLTLRNNESIDRKWKMSEFVNSYQDELIAA